VVHFRGEVGAGKGPERPLGHGKHHGGQARNCNGAGSPGPGGGERGGRPGPPIPGAPP
jgi:hypothetical protein